MTACLGLFWPLKCLQSTWGASLCLPCGQWGCKDLTDASWSHPSWGSWGRASHGSFFKDQVLIHRSSCLLLSRVLTKVSGLDFESSCRSTEGCSGRHRAPALLARTGVGHGTLTGQCGGVLVRLAVCMSSHSLGCAFAGCGQAHNVTCRFHHPNNPVPCLITLPSSPNPSLAAPDPPGDQCVF